MRLQVVPVMLILLLAAGSEHATGSQLGQLDAPVVVASTTSGSEKDKTHSDSAQPEAAGRDAQDIRAPASPGGSEPQSREKETADARIPDEIDQLRQQILTLQNKGKLGFRKVVACSAAEGFGNYSPIQPGQPVSKVVMYFEPANVSTLISDGRYIIDCTVDLLVYDLSGKPLGGKEGVGKINRVSRSPVLDLFFKIEMPFKKPLSGGILVKTVLHDKIKNQSATSTQRVNFEPKGKAQETRI